MHISCAIVCVPYNYQWKKGLAKFGLLLFDHLGYSLCYEFFHVKTKVHQNKNAILKRISTLALDPPLSMMCI